MKRIFSLILALCLILLCGCTGRQASETTASTAESTTAPTTEATTVPTTAPVTEAPTTEPTTEPTAEPTTEPVSLYHNPLTGEALDALPTNRLYAVALNNVKAAMPQYGIGEADVLCEISTEGGTTRCLGIYYDFDNVKTLGSIRSARPYIINLAQSFDAILVHAGGSAEARELMASTGWETLDGVRGSGAGNYFYRDQSRLNAGYAYEHTLFITPANIASYTAKLGHAATRSKGVDLGWNFSDDGLTDGSEASTITAWFSVAGATTSSVKTTTLNYSADNGLYYARQHGSNWVDDTTGSTLSFRNVLVLRTATTVQNDNKGRLSVELTGSGTGYFACNGTVVNIKWSRASDTSPFAFTLEDGTPITLGVGKTYIAFLPTKAVVTFE